MVSTPVDSRPVNGGLYALVNAPGSPEGGKFGEIAWMLHEVAADENNERASNGAASFWHRVECVHVDDFPA